MSGWEKQQQDNLMNEQMNTTENNKKLAEFMSVESNGIVFQDENTKEFHPIKYHSDWNWLMGVVEKIESLEFDFAIYTGSSASIINTGNFPFKEIVSEGGKNKIEAVYNACIEFVEWYNKEQIIGGKE